MKTTLFLVLTLLLVFSLFLLNIFAQSASSVSLGEHQWTVYSVAFSPDGSTLATGGSDQTIRLWNAATGEHKLTLKGHQGPVTSVAFSPDGSTLGSGSGDKTIRLWKLPSTRVNIAPNLVE